MSSKYVLHKKLRKTQIVKHYTYVQITDVEFPESRVSLDAERIYSQGPQLSLPSALSPCPHPELPLQPLWSPLVSFTHNFLSTYRRVRHCVNH